MVEKTNKLIKEFLNNKLDPEMGIKWWDVKRIHNIEKLIENLERLRNDLTREELEELDIDSLKELLNMIWSHYKEDYSEGYHSRLKPFDTVKYIDNKIDTIVDFLKYHLNYKLKQDITTLERKELAIVIHENINLVMYYLTEKKPETFPDYRASLMYYDITSVIMAFTPTTRKDFERVKTLFEKERKEITEENLKEILQLCFKDKRICEIGGAFLIGFKEFGADVLDSKGKPHHIDPDFITGDKNEELVNLKNWKRLFGKKPDFDITASSSVIDSGSGVHEMITKDMEKDIKKIDPGFGYRNFDYAAIMELFCIFSNLTKVGGFSIHTEDINYNKFIGVPMTMIAAVPVREHRSVYVYQKTADKDISYDGFLEMYKRDHEDKVYKPKQKNPAEKQRQVA
ncbi:MAG: hypothetical protein KKE20_04400 [Nanoarchaeota archaeon]|nr:hypothetical protein [Nanoarchaeota archaeon]